jgi:hypothetical protein
MKFSFLVKLKDPRTDWKYILILVILAIIVGGGILWFKIEVVKEITSLIQFPQIKRLEKEKRGKSWEVTPQETLSYQEFISHPEILKHLEKLLEANPGLEMKDFYWRPASYEVFFTPIEELPSEISIPPFPSPTITSSFWRFSPDNTKAVAMHFKIYKTENERVPVLLLYNFKGVSVLEDSRPFEGVEIEFFNVSWLNNKQLIHVFQGISYYEALGGERKEKPVGSFLEIDLIDLEKQTISLVGNTWREGSIFNNPWQNEKE